MQGSTNCRTFLPRHFIKNYFLWERILRFCDKKYRILTFCDKKYRNLTFRKKTELYWPVLQQNNVDTCLRCEASLSGSLSGSLWLSLGRSGYHWLALRPSGRLITKERLAWPHIFSMFCCKTVEFDSVLSRNVKIRHFLSRNVKIRAMSQKNGINCAASWLRILSCSATQTACLYTYIALVAFLTTIWHGWAIAWWAPASTPLALSGGCPSFLLIDPHLILLTGKQWQEEQGLLISAGSH